MNENPINPVGDPRSFRENPNLRHIWDLPDHQTDQIREMQRLGRSARSDLFPDRVRELARGLEQISAQDFRNATCRHVLELPERIYYNPFDEGSVRDLNHHLWVAEIEGFDPKYTYKRRFIDKRFDSRNRRFEFRLEYDRVYEERNYNFRRFFIVKRGEQTITLKPFEVDARFEKVSKKKIIVPRKTGRYGFISRGMIRNETRDEDIEKMSWGRRPSRSKRVYE